MESNDSGESKGGSCGKNKGEEKLGACAMCVGVGSFSEPSEIPGLAHFVEHMLFMGSAKHPTENAFDAFIKRKGGSDNASTECEYTTYYFECHDTSLYQCMDMFAQFFISPLMKREAMTRERQAIESEFQMSLPSDTCRYYILSTKKAMTQVIIYHIYNTIIFFKFPKLVIQYKPLL